MLQLLKIDDLIDPRWHCFKYIEVCSQGNNRQLQYTEWWVWAIEAEIIETSELINKELKNANLPDEIKLELFWEEMT